MATPRWTTAEAFLNDLPRTHCTVKPRDLFCTVCFRINHDVAFDCPLREVRQARAPYEARPAARPAEPEPYDPAVGDAVPSAILAEGPVIEFAPASEPPAKKRMKAKPLEKRGPAAPLAARPAAPAPPAAEESADDDLARELKEWNPEAPAGAPEKSASAPAPAKPPTAAESDEKRGRWRKR